MYSAANRLQFHRFDRLDSTNAKAKELAITGAPHGTVVVATEQTCGRGRLGRSFFSPGGSGVYLSMIIRPEEIGLEHADAVLLTTAASVAVARAVRKTLDLDLQIKWVNDLYYNDKKVCGILAEGVIDPKRSVLDAVVIGIGVNVQEPPGGFPEELKEIAGALTGDSVSSTDDLAAAIAEELWAMLPTIGERSFLAEYRQRSLVLGKRVRLLPKNVVATAINIDNNGGLIVRHADDSIETLTTGEISLRIV